MLIIEKTSSIDTNAQIVKADEVESTDINVVKTGVEEFRVQLTTMGEKLKVFHQSLQQLEHRKKVEIEKQCMLLQTELIHYEFL